MDRFDAMQAFARVVEAGSFTRAADTLQLSRATVTQLVQQLEARLRVRLLHRTTRHVRVTADGAAYYERVLRLLADLDDAETSLSDASAQPRGRLRVDVPAPLARLVLVPALPDFLARFPDVQLDLGVSDRMVDLIRDHVDCVVRGGALAPSTLMARRIGDLPLQVCASPGYLARAGTPDHPSELESPDHRLVRFGQTLPFMLQRDGEQVVVRGPAALSVDDGNAYLAAAVAGIGVACLPTYMAAPHVTQGELVPLFDGWAMDPMPLHVVFPPDRHVSAKLRVFIEWVADLTARHAPRR